MYYTNNTLDNCAFRAFDHKVCPFKDRATKYFVGVYNCYICSKTVRTQTLPTTRVLCEDGADYLSL